VKYGNYFLQPFFFFFFGIFLELLPISMSLAIFHPRWIIVLFLVSFFYSELRFPYVYAFFSGLFLDVMYGSPLGQHVFAMIILAFLLLNSSRSILRAPLLQALIVLAIYASIFEVVILVIDGFIGISDISISDRILLAISNCFWWFGLYLLLDLLRFKKIIHGS
jgi:rod shape-determining protein MreD